MLQQNMKYKQVLYNMNATSGISNHSSTTVQLQNREYLGRYHETFTLKCGEQRSSDPWTSIKCQMLRPLISCFISGFSCEYPQKFKRPQFQAHAVAQLLTITESHVNPPCSAPWGCWAALSSGTGHLNPSGDQYKAASYSRTQAERLIPWTLQLFIKGEKLHKPSQPTNMPHSVHHPQCFKHFTFLCRPRPDPSAQTRQTPHKLKPYKLGCADLRMHLREGLGRAPRSSSA